MENTTKQYTRDDVLAAVYYIKRTSDFNSMRNDYDTVNSIEDVLMEDSDIMTLEQAKRVYEHGKEVITVARLIRTQNSDTWDFDTPPEAVSPVAVYPAGWVSTSQRYCGYYLVSR